MNGTKKNLIITHLTIILAIAFLTITQGNCLSDTTDMNLTIKISENSKVLLKWDGVSDANYYKIYRTEVNSEENTTAANLDYVILGTSEVTEFAHDYFDQIGDSPEVTKNSSYLYYVTAIDALEKEIGTSNIVKFSLPLQVEDIKQ